MALDNCRRSLASRQLPMQPALPNRSRSLKTKGVIWKRFRGSPMSGRRSALQANGIVAARVPLSGSVGGRFAGDIVLPLLGRDLCVEVKARAAGFRELYCWLRERDVLIVKADRQEPLVIVRSVWPSTN